jgi:hypothetical protein
MLSTAPARRSADVASSFNSEIETSGKDRPRFGWLWEQRFERGPPRAAR